MKKIFLVTFDINMNASNQKTIEIKASKLENVEKILSKKFKNKFINIKSIVEK